MLPERWNAIGSAELYPVVAEPLTESRSVRAVRRLATFDGVSIVAGSITERGTQPRVAKMTPILEDRIHRHPTDVARRHDADGEGCRLHHRR